MKALPLPCRRLDLRVARMTTSNGGPVSIRRRKIQCPNQHFRAKYIDIQIKCIFFYKVLSILEYMYMRWVTRKSLPETSKVERQPTKHQHSDQGRPKIDDPIHNPNFQTDRIRKPGQNFQLTRDPRYFSNPRIRSIYRRNPQSVSFLRPNPPIRRPIHPPLYIFIELFLKLNNII